jgi:hypothetical protein
MFFDLAIGHTVKIGSGRMWVDESAFQSRNGRYKRLLYVEHYGRWADDFTLQSLRENARQLDKNADYSYTIVGVGEPF